MHSKWKIWDFFKARPEVLTAPGGIIAFSCFDQLAFKLIKDRFPNKDAFYEGKITVLLGREVSSDWFDDNFLSLGLFGNQESYLIHFAEELSPEVKEKIVTSKELLLDGRYLFLNFSKEDAFFKKILKVEEIETIQIQAPAFWEESELLDFLCEEYQVYLSYSAKEKIKEKVPFDINNYSQILGQIKINFIEQKEVSVEEIIPLITMTKLDQFELANWLGTKSMKKFYEKMISLTNEGIELFSVLYFLQSHFIKMYDLSYMDSKKRLTKYDKQIIAHSKIWTKPQIVRGLNYLGELLIQSKQKDILFEQKLKSGLLKTFNF